MRRDVDSVTLLAVSKTHPAESIRAAAADGVEHFGESYVKEALPKIETLRGLELTWHFIGQLQANKTRAVAETFDWVHGVDRLRIAERLSEQRPFHAPPLNVCLQVNVGGERTKGGVAPGGPAGAGGSRCRAAAAAPAWPHVPAAAGRRANPDSGTGLPKRRGSSARCTCRAPRSIPCRWA